MKIATMRTLRHAVAVSALAILLALGPPAGAAPPPEEDLRYLPADCQFVLLLRVDQALANRDFLEMPRGATPGSFAQLEAELEKNIRAELGTYLGNIKHILVGGNAKGEPVEIIRFKNPVKPADILAARQHRRSDQDKATVYKEVRVGTSTVYEPDRDDTDAFSVVEGKGVLLARPKALRAVLERDKRPEFSADMGAALQLADFSSTFTAAFDLRGFRAANPDILSSFHSYGLYRLDVDKLLVGATAAMFSIQFGQEFVVRSAIRCGDAGAAKTIKERAYVGVVEMARSLAKEGKSRMLPAELVQTVKVSADSEIARVRVTLKAPSFMQLLVPELK